MKYLQITKVTELNQDYVEGFFGDTSYLGDMSNAAIKRAIAQLQKQWIAIGDYKVDVDPTAQEVCGCVKH